MFFNYTSVFNMKKSRVSCMKLPLRFPWNYTEFHGIVWNSVEIWKYSVKSVTQEGFIGEIPRVKKSCDSAPFRKEGQFCVTYLCSLYFLLFYEGDLFLVKAVGNREVDEIL
jgi:hypothetical protein